jgi:Cytochrome P450
MFPCSRLLARHQNALSRLRDEIESTVGLGVDAPLPTRNDLKKMPYLNLVIKEGNVFFLFTAAMFSE